MSDQVQFLKAYQEFQHALMSNDSKFTENFISRVIRLENDASIVPSQLLTAAIGMSSESGELAEIVKKVMFHGKLFTEETREHLVKEMGDILWYISAMCNVLNVSLEQVINKNIEKLQSRYPGGSFDPYYSEHRKDGDI